jgi:hypothetical protein
MFSHYSKNQWFAMGYFALGYGLEGANWTT